MHVLARPFSLCLAVQAEALARALALREARVLKILNDTPAANVLQLHAAFLSKHSKVFLVTVST